MSLNSAFWIFLVLFFSVYFLLPGKWQTRFLLTASLLFFAFAGYRDFLLWLALTGWTYGLSRIIVRHQAKTERLMHTVPFCADKTERKALRRRREKGLQRILLFGILGQLAPFAVCRVGQAAVSRFPLGLAYITLSAIGYSVDAARKEIEPTASPARLSLFLCYFPLLWQGPIARWQELEPSLTAHHSFDGKRFLEGLLRLLWGTFKKMAIADTVAVAVSAVKTPANGAQMAALAVLYTVQIYADFTGGMDMMLGISHAIGVELFENFDRPFASLSVADYWRRWHRSLGRFFTDYVFYPLSTSRSVTVVTRVLRRVLGEKRGVTVSLYTVTLLTWALAGLWHGFAWNYLAWGLCNGLFMLVSRSCEPLRARIRRQNAFWSGKIWHTLCAVGTVCTVSVFRTLDYADSVAHTLLQWKNMFLPTAWRELLTAEFWQTCGLSVRSWIFLGISVVGLSAVSLMTPRVKDRACVPTPAARIANHPFLTGLACASLICAILLFGQYGVGFDARDFIYR